jgi:hypothetical protein
MFGIQKLSVLIAKSFYFWRIKMQERVINEIESNCYLKLTDKQLVISGAAGVLKEISYFMSF